MGKKIKKKGKKKRSKLNKKRIHEIEIGAAIILILISSLFLFSNPGITGYVSAGTKSQAIDLTIANSQSYILTTNSEDPFYLSSLKISGEVIGNGIAKAYVDNGRGQQLLIYSNIVKKNKGLRAITGMSKITGGVIGAGAEAKEEDDLIIAYLENIEGSFEIARDEQPVAEKFKYECIDSCYIEMLMDKDTSYQLLFYVEEGTVLKINEIVYTVRED